MLQTNAVHAQSPATDKATAVTPLRFSLRRLFPDAAKSVDPKDVDCVYVVFRGRAQSLRGLATLRHELRPRRDRNGGISQRASEKEASATYKFVMRQANIQRQ